MTIITHIWPQPYLDYKMVCPFIDILRLTWIRGLSLYAYDQMCELSIVLGVHRTTVRG